jgi:uncharacterized membrane protein
MALWQHYERVRKAPWALRWGRAVQVALLAAAGVSPLVTHAATVTGRGFLPAAALAAVQAGVALTLRGLPGDRQGWAGWGWSRLVLPAAALAWVAGRLLGRGLLAVSGVSHALISGGLLVVFGATLLPGRTPLVTGLARRLDPNHHAGMEGYTRGVTAAWAVFFAVQLAVSGLLLVAAPAAWWSLWINVLDLPLAAAMFVAEYGVRRLRFRRQRHVTVPEIVRAVRSGALGG